MMYVLISGSADVMVGDEVIESAGPGTFLGELALIDAAPRAATVVATADCRLVSLDQEQFHVLIRGTPYFATEVMKVMADRLRRMDCRRVGTGPTRKPASRRPSRSGLLKGTAGAHKAARRRT